MEKNGREEKKYTLMGTRKTKESESRNLMEGKRKNERRIEKKKEKKKEK